MEKRTDVCFTLIGNPFGTAGHATGASEERTDEGLTVEQRLVRNQAIVRGSPVIRRALVSAGTSLVAAGIAISRKPPVVKEFSSVKHSSRRAALKRQYPGDWKKRWAAERSKTRYYRSYSGPNIFGSSRFANDPMAQKQYWQRKSAAQQRRRAVRLGGAGGTLIAAGRLVPVVGYGIVIGSYLSYDGYGNIPTGVNTERIVSDANVLVERTDSMIDYGRQKAGEAYATYRALDMIWSAVQ